MATAVLRSHDCLRNPLDGCRDPSAPQAFPTLNPVRRTACRSAKSTPDRPKARSRRRTSFTDDEASAAPLRERMVSSPPSHGFVIGEVRILKRGEDLMTPIAGSEAVDGRHDGGNDGVVTSLSLDRLGPNPDLLPRQIKVDPVAEYAGPTTFSSPSPRSLPFPTLFVKKADAAADMATKGLRCLLRLETL